MVASEESRSMYLNDTHREKVCFTQFSTSMAAWLLLTFLHVYTMYLD